jgi:hypothetical protein
VGSPWFRNTTDIFAEDCSSTRTEKVKTSSPHMHYFRALEVPCYPPRSDSYLDHIAPFGWSWIEDRIVRSRCRSGIQTSSSPAAFSTDSRNRYLETFDAARSACCQFHVQLDALPPSHLKARISRIKKHSASTYLRRRVKSIIHTYSSRSSTVTFTTSTLLPWRPATT